MVEEYLSLRRAVGAHGPEYNERYVHLSKGHLEAAQKKMERFRARRRSA